MMWGMPWLRNFEWQQLVRLKIEAKTSRHISIFFLVLYIIFGCIVAAGCTSYAGREIYTTKLTYTATDTAMQKYSQGVETLEARVGYFALCLTMNTQSSQLNMACSTNETTVLLSDSSHFDQSVALNKDLFNFFMGTGKRFRLRCLDPYALIVSVVLSFACVACFAFTSPEAAPIMYKYAAGFSYLGFVLALVSAVWLETNVTTANEIMNRMTDVYYVLKAERGMVDRGLLWTGVALQFVSSVMLGMVGTAIEETEVEMGMDPKTMG